MRKVFSSMMIITCLLLSSISGFAQVATDSAVWVNTTTTPTGYGTAKASQSTVFGSTKITADSLYYGKLDVSKTLKPKTADAPFSNTTYSMRTFAATDTNGMAVTASLAIWEANPTFTGKSDRYLEFTIHALSNVSVTGIKAPMVSNGGGLVSADFYYSTDNWATSNLIILGNNQRLHKDTFYTYNLTLPNVSLNAGETFKLRLLPYNASAAPSAGKSLGFEDFVIYVNAATSTVVTNLLSLSGCGTVIYKGNVYASSTVVRDTVKSGSGADSVYNIMKITVVNAVNNVVNLSGCNSVVYKTIAYTNSTILRDTIKSVLGCDSLYNVINITVNKLTATTNNVSLTGTDTITYRGILYTNSIVLRDTVKSFAGCDSIYNIATLTINHSNTQSATDSAVWVNTTSTPTGYGTAKGSQVTVFGSSKITADSMYYAKLDISKTLKPKTADAPFSNATYSMRTFAPIDTNGVAVSAITAIWEANPTSVGKSDRYIEFAVHALSKVNITGIKAPMVSTGGAAVSADFYYSTDNWATSNLIIPGKNQKLHKDTFYTYNLTLPNIPLNAGGTFKLRMLPYNASTAPATGKALGFEDLVIYANSSTNQVPTNNISLTGCGSEIYKGNTYYTSTVVNDTVKSVAGADSVYNVVSITVINPTSVKINLTGCNSVTYKSIVYTSSTVIFDTVRSVQGCDSINNMVKITVYNTSLSGNVLHPSKGYVIPSVKTYLTGTSMDSSIGMHNYSFNCLPVSGNYIIRNKKNNDVIKANGVSTIDAALVQSHILGKAKLNSPYKLIAADLNGDGKVTALDIVFMKRLILGLDSTFTKTTTGEKRLWAFVDSSFVFADSTNPFPYKDSFTYNGLNANYTNQTFIGMKLGDVNWDWNPAVARPFNNTVNVIELSYDAVKADKDGLVRIPVMVKHFKEMMGMQFTVGFNAVVLKYKGIENSTLNIETGTSHTTEGKLSMLWLDTKNEVKTLEDGSQLMTLVFERTSPLSDINCQLSIDGNITAIEAFDKDYQTHGVVMKSSLISTDLSKESFVIAPNPITNGVIHIQMNLNANKALLFKLLDNTGKTILTRKAEGSKGINNFTISQDNLQHQGVYFLQVVGMDGEKVKQIQIR